MTETLQERLRTKATRINEGHPISRGSDAAIMVDAADKIDRLEANNTALDNMFAEVCKELGCEANDEASLLAVSALKDRVQKLEQALRGLVEDLELRSTKGVIDCSQGVYVAAYRALEDSQ